MIGRSEVKGGRKVEASNPGPSPAQSTHVQGRGSNFCHVDTGRLSLLLWLTSHPYTYRWSYWDSVGDMKKREHKGGKRHVGRVQGVGRGS